MDEQDSSPSRCLGHLLRPASIATVTLFNCRWPGDVICPLSCCVHSSFRDDYLQEAHPQAGARLRTGIRLPSRPWRTSTWGPSRAASLKVARRDCAVSVVTIDYLLALATIAKSTAISIRPMRTNAKAMVEELCIQKSPIEKESASFSDIS